MKYKCCTVYCVHTFAGMDNVQVFSPRLVLSVKAFSVQGVVSDANAYAMGGISGHAGMYFSQLRKPYDAFLLCTLYILHTCHEFLITIGLFSNVFDILTLCRALMFARADDAWLNSTTVATFTKVGQSGWSQHESRIAIVLILNLMKRFPIHTT